MTDLERVAAAHWRGTEEEWLGEWLLRAADGFTGRANSALPLGDPGLPLDEALDYVTRWYRDRGLPPMIAVPVPLDPGQVDPASPAGELDAELARRSWPDRGRPRLRHGGRPAALRWVGIRRSRAGTGRGRGASLPAGLSSAPTGPTTPGSPGTTTGARRTCRRSRAQVLTSAAGAVVREHQGRRRGAAIARLSIAEGWAGLTAVEVHPGHRRQGLGAAVTAAACAEAAQRGVHRVFLQVEADNAPAQALYERLGFRYSPPLPLPGRPGRIARPCAPLR